MVNTKHDTSSYESRSYQREIFDGNVLYEAYTRAKKGSDWKAQVQRFEMNYLLELSNIQRDLEAMEYEFLPTTSFMLNERGKTRYITGEQINDRIVKHALCDEVLNPSIERYLIYDNGASLEGKGIDFTRRRLVTHLRKYYAQHQSNEGYVLLIDFSKYYDNIRHDILMELFEKYVDDEHALWLLRKSIDRSKVDVSYMTDDEYENCLNRLFNSLLYQYIDKSLLTETGRVIQKINPKRLTGMRRKMKKLAPKMTEKEFTDWYQSWFQNHYRIMSKQQRANMDKLFNQLKEVTKCRTQSHSQMDGS